MFTKNRFATFLTSIMVTIFGSIFVFYQTILEIALQQSFFIIIFFIGNAFIIFTGIFLGIKSEEYTYKPVRETPLKNSYFIINLIMNIMLTSLYITTIIILYIKVVPSFLVDTKILGIFGTKYDFVVHMAFVPFFIIFFFSDFLMYQRYILPGMKIVFILFSLSIIYICLYLFPYLMYSLFSWISIRTESTSESNIVTFLFIGEALGIIAYFILRIVLYRPLYIEIEVVDE